MSAPDISPPILEVEDLFGPMADPSPSLLVEVPHGADRRAHYESMLGQLRGALPVDLHCYFHINTEVGAWQLGREVARRVVELAPTRRARVVRCLIPRTFIDTNRLLEEAEGGGMSAAIAPYIEDAADRALLVALHRAYTARVGAELDEICGAGGLVFLPHSYGPRTMGIAGVDSNIVEALRAACAPGTWESWPLRPEIDLITTTPDGRCLAPQDLLLDVAAGFEETGFQVARNTTYSLHPSSMGARWAARHAERTLCMELRRDLVVEHWSPFEEMQVDPEAIATFAAPVAEAFDRALRARGK